MAGRAEEGSGEGDKGGGKVVCDGGEVRSKEVEDGREGSLHDAGPRSSRFCGYNEGDRSVGY